MRPYPPPRQRAAAEPLLKAPTRSFNPRSSANRPQLGVAPGFNNPFAPNPLGGPLGSGFAPGFGGLAGLPPDAVRSPALLPGPVVPPGGGAALESLSASPPPETRWDPAALDTTWRAVQSLEQAAPVERKPWRIWQQIVPALLFGAIIALPVVLFTAVPAAALLGFAVLPDAVIAGTLVLGMLTLVLALYAYDRVRKNFTHHDILAARLRESAPTESATP